MLWLYIHFPHLLLDHIRSSRDASEPLVVTDAQQQSVYQACPQARALGIQPGMRLKTAISLAPALAFSHAAPEREQQVLEQQARWLYRHAAHITLCPPDGLLAEAASMHRLHGGLDNFWQTLVEALDQRQLTAWLATGRTPKAARFLARSQRGQCSDSSGVLDRLVAELGIFQAGLPERTAQRLARMGLTTLAELFSLPPAEVARRLEPETLRLIQQLQGSRPDPQTPWSPPHRFVQRLDFACDIEQVSGLLFPLQRMLGELEDDLQWRQQDTDRLQLALHHRHQPDTRLTLQTAGPEHRAANFLALVRLRLEQQALAAPVASMTLAVQRFIPREQPTGADLLGDGSRPEEGWQTLMSKLQARLGDQALKVLAARPDHRPERAWQPVRLSRPDSSAGQPRPDAPSRPLWLLQTPQPVVQLPQAWLAGPERISGGWWDGERVQRDYYVAQLGSGQLAWVFRDVSGGWFIHGLFG
ncbi:MAG: DNA polymerase Y family protein [Marinobacter sp.]|uniref:Y-family DNA polymerase n=1 Tax=Marinobacter sp. TaxID=50741 RepID=UPI00299F13D6|nr:DNA polymerase Y family protein [Marinobacter sp.]MDX1634736.1 DNA polymerase Y family protein [Marinobacter sp.]